MVVVGSEEEIIVVATVNRTGGAVEGTDIIITGMVEEEEGVALIGGTN